MCDLTLLYAEDDLESRKNYAFVLEEYFSEVYIAKDGREALKLYYEKTPDLLFLDISLPYIDGLEVAKIVRKENKKIPIIILTAHSEQDRLIRAVNLKLEEYLLKPINDRDLRKAIFKVINEMQNEVIIPLREKIKWNKANFNLFYEKENIKLTKKEHKLMVLLTNSIDEYFTHDTLILQIWDDEIPDASHDNKLYQLVYRLNRKVNKVIDSDIRLIENSYTLGYRVNSYF